MEAKFRPIQIFSSQNSECINTSLIKKTYKIVKITMYKIIKPINKCVISVYVETYLSLWQKKKHKNPTYPY